MPATWSIISENTLCHLQSIKWRVIMSARMSLIGHLCVIHDWQFSGEQFDGCILFCFAGTYVSRFVPNQLIGTSIGNTIGGVPSFIPLPEDKGSAK